MINGRIGELYTEGGEKFGHGRRAANRQRSSADLRPASVTSAFPASMPMRSTLLSLAALLLSVQMNAQLNAGEVPAGMTALDLNIDIALSTNMTTDSASLELDCDDLPDAWAVLYRGFPGVDLPNYAMLHFVDSNIEVCQDMALQYLKRPLYYDLGQELACTGNFNWQSGAQIFLGELGGFTAIGPAVIDSLYIAYRSGTTLGWIELSFDINDDAEINLQVYRVLSLCGNSTFISPNELPAAVSLFPNPGHGEPVRVESADALRSIDVLDATGRTIAQYNGTIRTIAAPQVAGAYLLRVLHVDGRRSVSRMVRY
jgi:hypothetical protein